MQGSWNKGTFELLNLQINDKLKVFVITGDHPTTAKALAQQIGLINDGEPVERSSS